MDHDTDSFLTKPPKEHLSETAGNREPKCEYGPRKAEKEKTQAVSQREVDRKTQKDPEGKKRKVNVETV